MGLYTANTHFNSSSANYVVEAAKGYHGQAGLERMLAENVTNLHTLFEAGLMADFRDAYALAEGASMEDIEALQEASLRGFGASLIEWVKGLWAKIKGFFQNFFKAMAGLFMKDKTLVKKYKSMVIAKNLSKMKFKYRKPKDNEGVLNDAIGKASKKDSVYMIDVSASSDINNLIRQTPEEIRSKTEKLQEQDEKDRRLGDVIGKSSISASEWYEEYMDFLFEDEDEIEGADSEVSKWCEILEKSETTLKDTKKAATNVDNYYKKALGTLDKAISDVSKTIGKDNEEAKFKAQNRNTETEMPGGSTDSTKKTMTAALQYVRATVELDSYVQNKIAGALCDSAKFKAKQARRCFLQAVAFNEKAHKEQAAFLEAVADASDYEFDSEVEGICY